MPTRGQGQEQRASQQWKGGRTAAVRRRPSATDPGDKGCSFSASAEGNARGPSGSKPHGGGGASEGECGPQAILLAGVRASPSATVTGGERSRSESRRCHRSEDRRCEWSGSGGSKWSPRKRREFSREWLARGSSTRSSQTTPFRSLVWGRSGRSSWFTFVRLRNLDGAKRRERLCIAGSGQLCQEEPVEESTGNQRRQAHRPAEVQDQRLPRLGQPFSDRWTAKGWGRKWRLWRTSWA